MAEHTPPRHAGGGSFLTREAIHGVPNWVLLAGGGLLLYLYLSKKGSSSASTTTPTVVPTSTVPASGSGQPIYVIPQGTATPGSPGGGINPGVPMQPVTGSTPPASTGGTPSGGGGVPSASTPSQVGYGQENIGGTEYTLLGYKTGTGSAPYPGYNVGGGAPVFYLAPGSTTPTQGYGQAVPSAQVLVPSIYDPWVSAQPVPNA